MNISDINLDNFKVVIFDFDNTLALHQDRNFFETREKSADHFYNYFLNAYKYPHIFFEKIEPCIRSEELYNLTLELRKKGIKMFVLSGMRSSFAIKAKEDFVSYHYGPDIEVFGVANQSLKVEGVILISKLVNCNINEILFIDDREDTIKTLKEANIPAFHFTGK
ncbi:MAG: hypothetical protein Q4E70_01175 [Candidatus Saccharibacteria bacterium]|nr:hypothetical protein [Candidatus Saccharibacteria bacterium]